jgi:uncharacterized Tic20 family protein
MDNDATEPSSSPADSHAQRFGETPIKEIKNSNTMAMLCHLLSLILLLGFPFGNILGPLIIWLLKRHEDPFIDFCGKESLNFQISMTIYMLISAVLVFILVGIVTMLGLMIANIVLTITAAIKASEGTHYKYPITIRFIK